MAIKQTQQGFALFVAVIFMSVMLSLGLVLGSIGYKQQLLSLSTVNSQTAFYVADAALECVLYADQVQDLFAYTSNMSAPAPVSTCDNMAAISHTVVSHDATRWVIKSRFSLESGEYCADVMISKPEPASGGVTYLLSQGYSVPCSTVGNPTSARFASRGIAAHY